MTAFDKNAVKFVFNVLNDLDNKTEVIFNHDSVKLCIYRFKIISNCKEINLEFSRALMDDFEVASEKHKGTDYYYTLENAIRFDIYIALGSKGLITDFDISSELLNEKGQWSESLSITVTFDNNMCQILNDGLRRLSSFLEQIVSEHDLELKDLKAEKEYIDGLIQYNENHGHLNSGGAGIESLGYLKAAALCEIIEKEKQKSQTIISSVKKEIDKEIYRIVQILRQAPFLGIKLPECIHDYFDANKGIETQEVPEKPQIGIGYQTQDKLNNLLDNLDPNLKKKRIGSWMAFNSTRNPDRLSQSANSMVELLDKVIGQLCINKKLSEYLEKKYGTSEETQWIDATRKWISETKSKLQRVKHHPDYQAEILARTLLTTAETIMMALLE